MFGINERDKFDDLSLNLWTEVSGNFTSFENAIHKIS